MRRITVVILTLALVGCATAPRTSEYQMEIPMYDGENITPYQKKINDEFVNQIKALIEKGEYKDLRETSDRSVQRGWEAFREGKYSFSVRRFNQGWLLDETNPDVYWGFGDFYGATRQYEKSISMLKRSRELKPSNLAVWADEVKSYNSWAFEYANSGNTKKAQELLLAAIEVAKEGLLNGDNGSLYYNYSISLFYVERYKEAKEAAEKAISRGTRMEKGYMEEIDMRIAKSNI